MNYFSFGKFNPCKILAKKSKKFGIIEIIAYLKRSVDSFEIILYICLPFKVCYFAIPHAG
ncbi:hypothetical protein Halhy_1034 [Haliscomenobacter hydrossis DSM 1100]|uniref:Uncharacterized protein n=1 Tax=Haliscomenobacter hydrossis (strain ATCC 27775 / DSM 1100 / LMG 10767 / O) TaxID=760192 RepID=F4KQA7_HALH1|nr:hypothetical protein Halhy_1034 [Haliscomenobacter hydrossis DSM 1100]